MKTDRARTMLDAALLLAALVLGGLAVIVLRQPWARASGSALPWLLLASAALLGGAALRRADAWVPDLAMPPQPGAATTPRRRTVARSLLGVAALATAFIVLRLWPDYRHWHGTVAPWIAAMALTLTAGFLLGRTWAEGDSGQQRVDAGTDGAGFGRIPRRLEFLLFLALAAAALAVRVWRIGQIPEGVYVDETNGGLDAVAILEGRDVSPFGIGWYGTPNGYLCYMALVFKACGVTWAGLKVASILPAFLTVLAIYPLGRLMFGALGGLLAMAFLAFSRWHMSMSRWGWNELTPPLFQILATFFLLRGLRDRRASDFAIGGVISGLMMYTYLSSRLALATLGVFAIYFLLAAEGGPVAAWRRHGRGLALFLFAWTVAVAPIAVTHITDPFTFGNRVSEISIFKDVRECRSYEPLRQNIRDHLKFFHQTGDHQTKHNLPNEPHADPLVGLLFVLGLAYALLRLRDPRRGLLWLWLLFGMAGGVFSRHFESPQSYRTLTAVPAVALLAADVLARIARMSAGLLAAPAIADAVRRRRRAAQVGTAVAVAGLAFSAVWECSVYFGPQARSTAVRSAHNPEENGIAHDVTDALTRGESVFVSSHYHRFAMLRFFVYGMMKQTTGQNTLDNPPYGQLSMAEDLPVPDTGRDTLVLFDIEYLPLLDYIRRFYPAAVFETAHAPDGSPIYIRARLSRADLAATVGLHFRATTAQGERREAVVRAPEMSAIPAEAVRAEWEGSVRIEQGGVFDFIVPEGFHLALDDRPWERPRHLGRGLHAIRLDWDGRGTLNPPTLKWVTPAGTSARIPDSALFCIRQPAVGLTTSYYANSAWQDPPLFETLTPILRLAWIDPDPIPGAFTARFAGFLRVTDAGPYRFLLDADDEATLLLDGQVVGRYVINGSSTFPATVNLAAGDHPIEIRYLQLGGGSALNVYWEPPDHPQELIPPERLLPLPASPARR